MIINSFIIFKEFLFLFILFLAVSSLCFLIYKKFKKRKVVEVNHIDISSTFDKEIFIQLMNQQFEKSFEAISDSLIKEYSKIYKLINNPKFEVNGNSSLMASDNNDKQKLPKNSEGSNLSVNSVSDGNLYDEAVNLAASGVSSKKIAEMLSIPFGEIDLIMKLNSNEVSWGNMERRYN